MHTSVKSTYNINTIKYSNLEDFTIFHQKIPHSTLCLQLFLINSASNEIPLWHVSQNKLQIWIVIVRVESCSEAEAVEEVLKVVLRGHVSYLKELVSDSEDISCIEL